MKLFTLKKSKCSQVEFVEFWSKGYNYKLEKFYEKCIGAKKTKSCILNLFKWKNNRELSEKKKDSVENNYISSIMKEIPARNLEEAKAFYNADKKRKIWDIFWLHILNPKDFPIFDQHTYRAYCYINFNLIREIPTKKDQVGQIYFNQYIAFYKKFGEYDNREVDKALFVFGKFLLQNKEVLEKNNLAKMVDNSN